MKDIFKKILFLFFVGSAFGWVLEFFYRSTVLREVTLNFGFLHGIYLPIYGFGAVILYFVYKAKFSFLSKMIIFVATVTLMEFLSGLFFNSFLKLNLWDYSNISFNYKGVISLLHSSYWLVIFLCYSYLRKYVKSFLLLYKSKMILTFAIVFDLVVMIDFVYSILSI